MDDGDWHDWLAEKAAVLAPCVPNFTSLLSDWESMTSTDDTEFVSLKVALEKKAPRNWQ